MQKFIINNNVYTKNFRKNGMSTQIVDIMKDW
jgi:hypothetical protein